MPRPTRAASIPRRTVRRLRRVAGASLAELRGGWQRRRDRASAARRAWFLSAVRAAELAAVTVPVATVEVIRLGDPGSAVAWPGGPGDRQPDGLPAASGVMPGAPSGVMPGAASGFTFGLVGGVPVGVTPEAAIAAAGADLILLLAPDASPIRPDWLARLIDALADPAVVAATATLVQGPVSGLLPAPTPAPELSVRGRGTIFERATGIPVPTPRSAGDDPLTGPIGLADPAIEVAAAELACLLVRRESLQAVVAPGGSTPPGAWEARADDLDPYAAADLTLRLRAHGRIVGVPGAPVVVGRFVPRDDVPRAPGPPRVVDLAPDPRPREAFIGTWGPRLYRQAMLDALAAGGTWGGPLRVELDDNGERLPASLPAALAALGWRVERVGRDRSVGTAAGAPPPDVRIVTDPEADLRAPASPSIRVGWFADGPPAEATLEELDLVLAPPSTAATERAWDPAATDAAARLRDHLRAFLEGPRAGIWIETLRWNNAEDWGDYHFGRALQRALGRAGLPARVRLRGDWLSDPAARDDAAIHLLGLSGVAGRPGQLRILWQISHPERATPELYAGAEVVFVASEAFAARMAARTGRSVEPLLQATDPDRFRPEPGGPPASILAVANHRSERPAIQGLAGTGRDLAVWGRGWSGILDPTELRGERLPNAELGRAYAAAELVVSDTWAEMRDEGFIPNRIFDVLASGGFVVSDAIAGLDRLFGDAVPTYADADELRDVVDRFLADAPTRRALAERGRAIVLAGHTFDHRAAVIVERIGRHLAGRPMTVDSAR